MTNSGPADQIAVVPDTEDTSQLPSLAQLSAWADEFGFQAIGVSDIDLSEHEAWVKDWLARGFAGEMGYLHRNLDKRLNPELLEPETCRVISARMNYLATNTQPLTILEDSRKAYISRYALGRDYHKVLRRRLARLAARIDASFPDHRYRAFTDSAPILEKPLAAKAGLGWIGKHSLVLDESAGSWFFLGEVYTNAPLPVTSPNVTDQCGKCQACITVCPTDAIVAPSVIDARRCIAYLTIEHSGSIPVELRPAIGNRVFGCDDCQLYCPWNRDAPTTDEADFQPRHQLDKRSLADLFTLSESQFLDLTEGSALRRISYEQWQRNLAIGLGNGPTDPEVIQLLKAKRANSSEMVREHIDWALTQLDD